MGQGFKHQPADGFEGLKKRLDDLQTQIDSIRTAAGIRNTTISGGAGLTVNDGGDVQVLDANGNQIVKAGHDSAGTRGFALTTAAGVDMLDFGISNVVTDAPILNLNDSHGNLAFATDTGGDGTGIFWPCIPIIFGNMTIAQWPSNSTGTFSTVAQALANRFSQGVAVTARVVCTGGATAGQVRLMADGVQMGATAAVTTSVSTASFTGLTGGTIRQGAFLTLEARVTAGAGLCAAQIYYAAWIPQAAV